MNLAAEPQFPTKWPFPPVPPSRRGLRRLAQLSRQVLSPFGRHRGPVVADAAASIAGASAAGTVAGQGVTVRQMVVDVLLVAMWGAMIPGLMWLGAAAGF
ncbi:hypothetical protein BOSP111201_26070 [Bordetella sputigena]|uniref:hypothetical protein n=1 Tax=Bordetella sputigena TaxID=1416810 RepID=UPI0039F07C92